MPDGDPVPDPTCGRCKEKIELVVRKEAVYQEAGVRTHLLKSPLI